MPWKADDTFYVAQIGPTVHYTMGGISANEFSECLDGSEGTGRPVPGLFCGGEVLGGIHGENRLGGSSLLDCVVFGRIAGKSSARVGSSFHSSATRNPLSHTYLQHKTKHNET